MAILSRAPLLWLLLRAAVSVALFLAAPVPALRAQNTNIFLPTDSIEHLFAEAPFEFPDSLAGARSEDDPVRIVPLVFADGTEVLTKWVPAPRGGDRFNRSPRYELAAYELQKLFLDEPEYVVPPTVVRAISLDRYRAVDDGIDATFDDAASVLVVLSYFVYGLSPDGVFDPERFDADSVYSKHWANANLFTYLIRHSDSGRGNVLISTRASNPRVFAVDNGVAFRSDESTRGTRWRDLLVDRFPAATVERLRSLTREGLHDALGVLAEWHVEGGQLVRAPPSDNLSSARGVRQENGIVQIGLTDGEIDDVWNRLEDFLRRVDRGSLHTF